MKRVINNILSKIEREGFEIFIVGGFVRDYILGKKSYDIDICTNATPKELIKLFPNSKLTNIGGIAFKIKKYNFEISTYREELAYENRRPIKISFINNIKKDLNRRDFTINTILMDKKGHIIDYLNGLKDLREKQIKIVGDINQKLKEDPLRIMRAIRFACILNFNIEASLKNAIKENSYLISKLSSARIKEELDKILLSENVLYGLELLKELGLLKILKISYKKIIPLKSIVGMYAEINCDFELPFNKKEKEQIKNLKEILKEETISSNIVYRYGLELSLIAAKIKELNTKDIKNIYNKLPIKSKKDIKITATEIQNTLNIEPKNISTYMEELENLIISGKIINTKKNIIKYLKSR